MENKYVRFFSSKTPRKHPKAPVAPHSSYVSREAQSDTSSPGSKDPAGNVQKPGVLSPSIKKTSIFSRKRQGTVPARSFLPLTFTIVSSNLAFFLSPAFGGSLYGSPLDSAVVMTRWPICHVRLAVGSNGDPNGCKGIFKLSKTSDQAYLYHTYHYLAV